MAQIGSMLIPVGCGKMQKKNTLPLRQYRATM
jgi:hypothetical protein